MTQPPDDRDDPSGPSPDPAAADQPTIAWTPPEPSPPTTSPEAPAAPGTDFAGTSGPPVGWGTEAPVAPPAVPAGTPAAPPAQNPLISADTAPVVAWAAPQTTVREVAPGLVFASTAARFVAFVIDLFILGVVDRIVISALQAMGIVPAPTIADPRNLTAVFTTDTFLGVVVTTAIGGAYFVLSWSGGRRATIGQRLLRIQVGNAFDGAPLAFEQAIRRWLGLGLFLGLFVFAPALAAVASLIQLVWMVSLLITTASSPTKQGLHDRLANSALVRPTAAGNGWVTACLVIVVILMLLAVVSIVGLIALGGQVETILSRVGESI